MSRSEGFGAVRPRSFFGRVGRFGAMLVAATLLFSGVGITSALATDPQPLADTSTTVYEIEGAWAAGTPNPVVSGNSYGAKWVFNINDSDPVPDNPPHENVTVTFTAEHGRFTKVPEQCISAAGGATPGSEIKTVLTASDTLVCNVGTRDLGTAELFITGVVAEGKAGDGVTMTGTIGEAGVNEVSAQLPVLDFNNTFNMDMKFDEGNPSVATRGKTQLLTFPWSLRHASGSIDGPDSVTYRVNFSGLNEFVTAQPVGCAPQTQVHPGYPNSSVSTTGVYTTDFPTCTLEWVSYNTFDLTLSDIDYSLVAPTKGSDTIDLPTEWDVIAAGLIQVQFDFQAPSTVKLTATGPTPATNPFYVDDTSNNTNKLAVNAGNWTGGWMLGWMLQPAPGSEWTDTSVQLPGEPVLSISADAGPRGTNVATGVCTVLDSKYVTFDNAQVGQNDGYGVVTPFPGAEQPNGVTIEYYYGNGYDDELNPNSSKYNPNIFECDGNNAWTTTKPANLSTVRAVRATIGTGVTLPDVLGDLWVDSTIKPATPIGTDVWTWTSYFTQPTNSTADRYWENPDRSMNPAHAGAYETLTPDARYPFAGPGRDVLRVIDALPVIKKEVTQPITEAGAVVDYKLKYRLESNANINVNNVKITDTLPVGLTYVAGSASIAPTSVNGQILTWNLNNVPTNTEPDGLYIEITLQVTVNQDAPRGVAMTNKADITYAKVTREASASTRIPDTAYTSLKKTVAEKEVPNLHGLQPSPADVKAKNTWTVTLTSNDSGTSAWTDTIDILPYAGDWRGTIMHSDGVAVDPGGRNYKLSGRVDAVAGATVYYSTTATSDDPADASNGAPNAPSGIWSTDYTEDATAVRVIGPVLRPSTSQAFSIGVVTENAQPGDRYVNRAEGRAERTELKMRTSAWFKIRPATLEWEKVDKDGGALLGGSEWTLTPVDKDDEPTGGAVLAVTDCVAATAALCDVAGLDIDPAEGKIKVNLPSEGRWMLEESKAPAGYVLDRTPHFIDAEGAVEEPYAYKFDDPIVNKQGSLTWEKVNDATGDDQKRLAGSEWTLTQVEGDGGAAIEGAEVLEVVDCVADPAVECEGLDTDPAAGVIKVDPIGGGWWILEETKAPAGYKLLENPIYVEILLGDDGKADINLGEIVNKQQDVPTLPLTGGMGTLWFVIATVGLGGATAGAVWWQRRRTRTQLLAA